MPPKERRLKPPLRRVLLLIAMAAAIGNLPTTTRRGINYQWTSHRITLFEKTVHFLSRDLQAQRLAREIAAEAASEEGKIARILSWVGSHVHPTPPGLPVVDDHVWHILVRGYGEPDQRAEAFALLASYVGLPAAAIYQKASSSQKKRAMALVKGGGGSYLVDVDRQRVSILEEGAPLRGTSLDRSVEGAPLRGTFLDRSVEGAPLRGTSLDRNEEEAPPSGVPFSRMEAQKPWPRLWQEISRRISRREENRLQ